MDGIENAKHDLFDARCSLETAIEVLSGLEQDGDRRKRELARLISRLRELKGGLDDTFDALAEDETPEAM